MEKYKISNLEIKKLGGVGTYVGSITYIDKNKNIKTKKVFNNLSSYYKMFLKSEINRENCYSCKYAKKERISDITIGDFWGITEEHPEMLKENGGKFEKEKGISCILVNTKKGSNILKEYGQRLHLEESTFEKVAKHNNQLCHPSQKPLDRNKILEIYKKQGYQGIDKYYYKKIGLKKYIYIIYYNTLFILKEKIK